MSKYDNTKFYWLILLENFFEDEPIQWLEEQTDGEKYVLFYIKLCLKSLKTNGILIRRIGELLLPYAPEKLAELTKTNKDTVIIAMTLFQKIGLVKKLENGALYLPLVEKMVGSKSHGAFKKQQQRLLGNSE